MQRKRTEMKTTIEIITAVMGPPGIYSENPGLLSITDTTSNVRDKIQ
ncbi:MAG: hypothetical protein ACFFFO_13830 [Candidatus Thorarchaeota archaeon]